MAWPRAAERHGRDFRLLAATVFAGILLAGGRADGQELTADLLVVGGNESACAAAVQAARLGVKRIVLVNDIDWLGGQFSAEGVGPIDERTIVGGKSVNFPRSGLFLELVELIRAHNEKTYGHAAPGNCWSATETVEPAVAARLFEDLLAPYAARGTGQVEVLRGWQPQEVIREGTRVLGVAFERTEGGPGTLTVRARLTIDCSDWGDVIRLSGAAYAAGVDPRSRFGEPSAPVQPDAAAAQEMNPITWAVTLREAGRDATVPRPRGYAEEAFAESGPAWVDSDMREGIYADGFSIYTQRRLVDRRHLSLPAGSECIQLNTTVQDYPLCQLPAHVAEALEKTEPGASRKNIVDLSPSQRRIIYADAKLRALGLLHYLQTKAHDDHGDFPQSFRYLELSDEFGTPDRLPPKPYIREGLRLEALHMLREQDIRADGPEPRWAKFMPDDAVFGFQFHIDFHPTRRSYLADRPGAAWVPRHAASRTWHTHSDRAMFPLRGLVPATYDGLLGGSKNIGVSSIVQAALRLHGQMMLCGQAGGTVAWLCLRDRIEPRALAADPARVREVQRTLVRGCRGPGVAVWPYQDLRPGDPAFEAANLMTLAGVWQPDADDVLFRADRAISADEWRRAVARAPLAARAALIAQAPRTRCDAVRTLMERAPVEQDSRPFLFSYFHGNGEDGLHLAWSEDGLEWQPLRGGRSFVTPQVGGKLMRDPSIVQGEDGVFHMVWSSGWWDRGFGYASSKDLIHWSEQRWIPVNERVAGAKNTWAPDLFFDATTRQFVIVFATTVPGRFPETDDGGDKNHRLYAVTTRDFQKFSDPALLMDPGYNSIDGTLFTVDGRLGMIYKDERPGHKRLHAAFAPKLGGPWTAGPQPIIERDWIEGPAVLRVGDRWLVYFDCYTKARYGAAESRDGIAWRDITDKVRFPEGARHGTAFTVSRAVLESLRESGASTAAGR